MTLQEPPRLVCDSRVVLESVITTAELEHRSARLPDYQAENRALTTLVRALADSPPTILQKLCETAVDLCQAGSAGISLLAEEGGGKNFYWTAVAGQWAPYVGNSTPRDFSPSGIALDHEAVQLFSRPERYYRYLAAVTPPIAEALVTPFYVEGKAIGTVWVIAHDDRRKFDREDMRQIANLASFVSVAYQVWKSHESSERQAHAMRESERSFREMIDALPAAIYTTDAEGRLTHFNPSAVEFSGRAPELGNDHWCVSWKLYYPDGTPMPHDKCPMAIALKEGRTVREQEAIAERPDGKRIWFIPYPTVLRDSKGQVIGGINMLLDITARKQAEEARSHLAAIVESSDDAIIGKNLHGIITTWNHGAEKLFGYTAAEAIGNPITMLIPPQCIHEELQILNSIKRGERVEHYETVRRRKDGTEIAISLTVSPIRDEGGNVTGASKIARDITERKKAEEEREELLAAERAAREAADAASRAKDEFLATVSHELRSPLNAMLGWARLLSRGKLDDETAARGLKAIEQNAKAQAKLIEDLLDVSRIISGKFRLNVEPIQLAHVMEAAIDSVCPAADAKGVKLQVSLDPDDAPVLGDAGRLQQMVWNLLSNAVKFTPKDGRVHVRLTRVNSHIEIEVSDTGQGIDPEFLPYVFDRFRQADSSTTRAYRGLGLGLAIVRHVVELHGGSVAANSPGKGQGATFTVRLPLMMVHTTESAEGRVQRRVNGDAGIPFTPSQSLEGVRVLLVDDESETLLLLSTLLTQCGAQVKTASSAEEGFIVVQEWRPTVIVSDIGMRGEDGYSFMKRVKTWSREVGAWMPAVALTAYARAEDRMKALSSGYQMHVPKPVEPTELITVITSLTERPTAPGMPPCSHLL